MAKKLDDNLEIGRSGHLTATGFQDLPGDKAEWGVTEATVKSDPVNDPGMGRKVVIKEFKFKLNPALKVLPTQDQILTKQYIRDLEDQLWANDLEMIIPPKCVIGGGWIKIFATCKSKSAFLPKAELVQDILNVPPRNPK